MNPDEENSPTVIAYRVGRLEKTVEKGFAVQTKQFEDFAKGFITRGEFEQKCVEMEKEHQNIKDDVKSINKNAKWWVGTVLTFMLILATVAWALKG